MINWSLVYEELIPEIKSAVNGNIFLCGFWALAGSLSLIFGLWFIAIPSFVISIWFFVIRNKPKKGLPYAVDAEVKEKFREYRRQTFDSGPDDEFYRYWLTLDIKNAFSFSNDGFAVDLPEKKGEKKIKVSGSFFSGCETNTEKTFVYLADDSIRGYIENDILVKFDGDPDWEKIEEK